MPSPDYRKKLREARERKGWSEHEAAAQVQLSSSAYYDIELCEDDLTTCYSLSEISKTCKALDLHPHDLFCNEHLSPSTIDEVIANIKKHCAQNQISISKFEDIVGWHVESYLTNPKTALEAWNLDCLKDVCSELQMNWQNIISGL